MLINKPTTVVVDGSESLKGSRKKHVLSIISTFSRFKNSLFQKTSRSLRSSPRAINTFSLISSQYSRRENLTIFLFFDLSTVLRPRFLSKYGRNFIGSISSYLITGPSGLMRFGVLSSSNCRRKLNSSSIFEKDDEPIFLFFLRFSGQVNLL